MNPAHTMTIEPYLIETDPEVDPADSEDYQRYVATVAEKEAARMNAMEGFTSGPIKCLSLWQPWASLMAVGNIKGKWIETRDWPTKVRGRIHIHAAQTREGIKLLMRAGDHSQIERMEAALGMNAADWARRLPFGEIVAVGDLYDSVTTLEAAALHPDQIPFGDFSPGRGAHLYRNLKPTLPYSCAGKQGFFTVIIP